MAIYTQAMVNWDITTIPFIIPTTRPIFFLRSSRIRVNLLSYESIPTDKREQYDWRAEKNLDGYRLIMAVVFSFVVNWRDNQL